MTLAGLSGALQKLTGSALERLAGAFLPDPPVVARANGTIVATHTSGAPTAGSTLTWGGAVHGRDAVGELHAQDPPSGPDQRRHRVADSRNLDAPSMIDDSDVHPAAKDWKTRRQRRGPSEGSCKGDARVRQAARGVVLRVVL